MKPLYERILIKPRQKETKTAHGILIPEKAVKKPNIGVVIACGDGSANNPMLVKPGDTILCNRYAGIELMYKGEKHYIILSNEVIAKLDDENEVDLENFD